jgi:uncharacterized protein YwqG
MKSVFNIDLPPEWEPFRAKIEATLKPYIKIEAKIERNLSLWQSKFRGLPYLPKNIPYPKGAMGQELCLLAQINFEEVPSLEAFPERGILQFYIDGSDPLHGLDLDDMTKQANFKVLYFPEVIKDESQLITNFDFLPQFEFMPVHKPSSLTFEQKYEPISAWDYQFDSKILGKESSKVEDKSYELHDKYQALFQPGGHKLGGYPYFTQTDPRTKEKYRKEGYILLLQIDTDHEAEIMWGDNGVGNFFIKEEDLQKLDFSKVLYNWDCA